MNITVNFAIRLNVEDPPVFLELSLLIFAAIFKLNFLKPNLFSFGYEYYVSDRMVASQLNRQIFIL